MLTGVWTQWAAREEHKFQTLQELPRLLDPRESHSDQMENRYVREEVRE
jgi:hypothetical protein